MADFEAHITCDLQDKDQVQAIGEWAGWSYSEIAGDFILGGRSYLTAHADRYDVLMRRMKEMTQGWQWWA